MMFTKSLLVLAAALCTVAPLASASPFEFDFGIRTTSQHHGSKPENALYSCVIKSRKCRKSNPFTSPNVAYEYGAQASLCHSDHLLKGLYNRLAPFSNRGDFVNTVYLSCPSGYEGRVCRHHLVGKNTLVVRDIVEKSLDFASPQCDSTVECYTLSEVDDKCMPLEE